MTTQALAVAQYARSAASTASPGEVVRLAYERIITACDRSIAAAQLRARDWMQVFHDETVRAQAILVELGAGLALQHDHHAVVDLAQSMDSLYVFCREQLMDANIAKDSAPLTSVRSVISGLRDAWVVGVS